MKNYSIKSWMALAIGLLTSFSTLAQQDPLYNQAGFNMLVVNPAYAGIHGFTSATLISRAQYLGMEGGPITHNASIHTSFAGNRFGAGLMLVRDELGVNKNTEAHLSYSYILKMRNLSVSMGIQGSYVNYRYDYSRLNLEFLDDQSFTPDQENFNRPNFGAGFLVYNDLFYVGASVPRILDVSVNDGVTSSTRYLQHYYFVGGVVLPVGLIQVKPSFLLKLVDGAPASVDFNASVLLMEVLWVGASLRNLNTFGASAQLEINDQLRAGYAFELPSNELSRSNYGTHEIMIAFDFAPFGRQMLKRRYF